MEGESKKKEWEGEGESSIGYEIPDQWVVISRRVNPRHNASDYHVKTFESLVNVINSLRQYIRDDRMGEKELNKLLNLNTEIELYGGGQFLTVVRSTFTPAH
jgi:hypothetical protein